MSLIDTIYAKAKQNKKRVVIPECTNPSMMRSAVRAAADGTADIIFVGNEADCRCVAAKKVKRPSQVAGQANVLIFPDAAANISSDLIQQFAPQLSHSYGPVYQGFRKPVLDCSRGDTEERIYDNIAFCSVMAAGNRE